MPIPTRAPSVLTSWSRTILLALEDRGLDPRALVERAGLDLEAFDDPNARFDVEATARLWRDAVEATGDPAFGLFASRFVNQTTFHALGYAVMASATLREALERNVRYGRLVSDAATPRLEEDGELCRLSIDLEVDGTQPADESIDAMMSMIARTIRALTFGASSPSAVFLRRGEPASGIEAWEKVFRAPVAFGARTNALEFANAELDKKLPAGNAELARHNDEVVARYLSRLEEERLSTRVGALLTEQLSSGEPTPEATARALGLSRRSMQRRLSEEGTSYKDVLNGTREALARAYLADDQTSITEVTFLLGFSDTTSFSRAFKRWTGTTPSEFEKSHTAVT